jgi:RNA recognition motif. (a.k.a. RRM, RBD, or RNP domain)
VKLRQVFSLVGNVITAEVVKDNECKSRGFGVVEMDHPVEAFQATFFNRTNL